MADKVKVGGLLGALEAEAAGNDWELDGVISGGPLLAEIGRRYLAVQLLEERYRRSKRGKGQPKKKEFEGLDAKRAFALWSLARVISANVQGIERGANAGIEISARELIRLVRVADLEKDVASSQRLFPLRTTDASLEQSVSRGRKILQIDDCWQSRVCEEMAGITSQTT